jgi:hypothetical protein
MRENAGGGDSWQIESGFCRVCPETAAIETGSWLAGVRSWAIRPAGRTFAVPGPDARPVGPTDCSLDRAI